MIVTIPLTRIARKSRRVSKAETLRYLLLLGSIATSTSYNGSPCQERFFYRLGELWTGAGSCGMHQSFAKLPDYDAETDQYNTLNRHYTPRGRWMSPEPDNADADQSQGRALPSLSA